MFKHIKEQFSKTKRLAKKQPKSLHYEELEQRVLFSADIMPGLDIDAVEEQVLVEDIANDIQVEREATPETVEQTAAEQRWELVFVNQNVADYEQLIADLQGSDDNRTIEVVVLDADRDGIEQVSEILAERSDVAAVHFITHGSEGQINLGNSRLTGTTLAENSDAVAGWGKALTETGDILFYGCKIAADNDGQSLLKNIAELTGAEVAASDDLTGNEALGGDWELEYKTGAIEAQVGISKQVLDNFRAILESANTSEAAYLSTPLTFEQNNGQTDQQVDFVARGSGYTVFLTEGDAVLMLQDDDAGQVVRLDLVGGDTSVPASGQDLLSSRSSYMIGNDQSAWQTDVANYGAVEYANVYDGIDLRYYGNQRQLEYDFIVSAGGDTSQIRLDFDGIQSAGIGENGDLLLTLNEQGGQIHFNAPISYQLAKDGNREAVQSQYVIHEDGTIGFELGAYDNSRELVIDPILDYGTFLGGIGSDTGYGIAVDASDNVYVAGWTGSNDFPTQSGYAASPGSTSDAFFSKFDATGTLLYSTYFGGTSSEWITDIAVDSSGKAYVTGYTTSTDLPTLNAYDTSLSGSQNAFVAKFDPSLTGASSLLYSSYFGGSTAEYATSIAVDASNNAYITGWTQSNNMPTKNAFNSSYSGNQDAFVAKFDLTQSGDTSLVYSTYIGGSETDSGSGIAVDSAGNAVFTGYTRSSEFPATANAYDSSYNGADDVFVAKLNSTGDSMLYATFMGSSISTNSEQANDIALDDSGNIYITGRASTSSFPTTAGAYDTTHNGGTSDAFVAKFDPSVSGPSSLVYSTFLGGSGDSDIGYGIVVDSSGNANVTGRTSSTDLPTTADAYDSSLGGTADAFLATISADGKDLDYLTYFGGAGTDVATGIALSSTDNIYLTGYTSSSDFPTTSGAYDEVNNGQDAFVAKFILNQMPIATDNSYTVAEGGTLNGNVIIDNTGAGVDSDPDGDTLTASVVDQPLHGTLILNADGSFTYTPYANFADSDSFVYQVNDGHGGTDTATVTLTVTPDATNEAPVNSVPATQTVNQDTPLAFSGANGNQILVHDDPDGNTIEVTLTASNGTVTLQGTTGLSITDGADGTAAVTVQGSLTDINNALNGLTFSPTAAFFGSASLQVTTNDLGQSGSGVAESDTDLISITVSEVNYSPVITSDGGNATASANVAENTTAVTTVTATDANPGDTLSYSVSGTDAALFDINSSTGALTFKSLPDFESPIDADLNNDYQITVTVSDGNGGTDSQDITVTVTQVVDSGSSVWSNTSTTPQTSTWDGSSFGSTTGTVALSDNYRTMQGADAPTRDEKIVVGIDATSNVTGEMWDGSSWSALPLNNLGTVSENYWYGADVAYEQLSGDAIIVWNDNSQAAGDMLRYAVWDGSNWSTPQSIGAYTGAEPQNIRLAFDPGSDVMVLVVDDVNADDYALVWDGSSWGNAVTLDTTGTAESDQSVIAVSFEAQSGNAMVTYGIEGSSAVYYRIWNGSSWENEAGVTAAAGITGNAGWLVTATDYTSDRIALATMTAAGEVWLNVWDGSSWETATLAETSTTGIIYPNLAVAFESTTGHALATYGESGQSDFCFRTWDSVSGWSAEQTGPAIGAIPNSMTLDSGPTSDHIMLSIQDASNDLHYLRWNGSDWSTDNELSTNTGEIKNQPFAFIYDQDGMLVDPNAAPVNTIPTTQNTAIDTPLIFSAGNGNAISVADTDDTNVEITLTATNGILTLSGLTGLSFSDGDGSADAGMTFTGTLADINTALDGLQFDPTAAFEGFASVQFSTTDFAGGGAGGVKTDIDAVTIEVGVVNTLPVNTVSAAQTIDQNGMLLFSSVTGTAISISDPDAAGADVKVTLTATNGTINLSGDNGLTFTTGDGIADATMTFTGTISDINTALKGMTFVATTDFTGTANLQITTDDLGNSGAGGALSDTDSVHITVRALKTSLWLSTVDDVASPGAIGLESWTGGQIIEFAADGGVLTFEPGTTTGTFSLAAFNLDNAAWGDANTKLDGIHRVTRDLTVGGIALQEGDVLFSTQDNETLDGVDYENGDIILFRPNTPGDYSTGTFSLFFDKTDSGIVIEGFTLVEQSVLVGDTTLNAGDLLLSNGSKDILRYVPAQLGDTTSGTQTTLIDGDGNLGLGKNITAIELVETTSIIGDKILSAGTLIVAVDGEDADVGSGAPIAVTRWDLFTLTVSTTGAGTTSATAELFLDGSDVEFNDNKEAITGVSLIANQAPMITADTFAVDENSANGTDVGTVSATDPEGSSLSYAITAGNTGGAFAINATTGQITVANSAALDFETTPSFTLTVAAIDDQGAYASATVTINLNDLVENTAPSLDNSGDMTLTSITEDQTGNAGNTVAEIIASAGGDRITDANAGDPEGIAVTGLNSSNGTWQYSIDGGSSWADVGTVSDSSALLLRDTDSLRFVPDGLNADSADVTFRAWDQSSGSAGSKVDTSTNGGVTEFSTATETAAITITAANDAPSFIAGDGMATPDILFSEEFINSVTIQPDGKILAAGYVSSGSDYDFLLVRYNADGSLDTGFGSNGVATASTSTGAEFGYSVTLQADGKILVAGQSFIGGNYDFALVRFNSDGTLDTTFSGDGKVTTDIAYQNNAYGVAVQDDGKILVSGKTQLPDYSYEYAVVRYNSDGTLDTTFSGDGIFTTPLGSGSNSDKGYNMAMQSDGKILLSGRYYNGTSYEVSVVRINTDGTLDTTFSGDGMATTDIGTSMSEVSDIAVQDDGKILVSGSSYISGNNDFIVVRYLADGTLDTTFDGDGIVSIDVGASHDYARTIELQSDGKILVGGSSVVGTKKDFSVVRLNTDGTLDTSFGDGDGKLTTYITANDDTVTGLSIQDDGKIVVSGYSNNDTSYDIAIVCYNPDGTLDQNFDPVNTLDGTPTFTEDGPAVVLDADVQIFDEELSAADDFSGATLTLIRNGGANAEDAFSATGNLAALAESGPLVLSGVTIGTVTANSAGTMILTFNANATQARVNETLQSIAYSNSSDTPPASAQIDWTFDDGNTGTQGTGGPLQATGSTTVTIIAVNDAPQGADKTVVTLEDTDYVFNAGDFGFTDSDDSPANNLLNIIIAAAPINGVLYIDANGDGLIDGGETLSDLDSVAVADITAGKLKFKPANNANGTGYDSFTFKVQDDGGVANGGIDTDQSANTITIDVTAQNDAPIDLTATPETHDLESNSIAAIGSQTGSQDTTATLTSGRTVEVRVLSKVIYADIFDADHNLLSTTNVIGLGVAAIQEGLNPVVAAMPDGGFVVVSEVTGYVDSGHFGHAILAQFYDADGNYVAMDPEHAPAFQVGLLVSLGTGDTSGINQINPTLDVVGNTLTVSWNNTTAGVFEERSFQVFGPSVLENAAAGTVVADLTAIDPDAGDTFTYSIVGGDSNFEIVGTELRVKAGATLDYETATSHSIVLRATDAGGLFHDETLSIMVTDVNEAPTAADSTVTTNEDTTYTFTATDFNFSDGDGDPLNSIQITSLETVGSLQLSGGDVTLDQIISKADIDAGNLKFVPVADANGAGYDSFEFTVNDGTLDSLTAYTMTVDVTAVNDAPDGLPTITGTVTEDQTLTAETSGISDIDGLGAFSYQWLHDGNAIGGATAGTYTLGDDDVGTLISVQVSYTDGQGTSETLTSAQTAAVININDAPEITIDGTVLLYATGEILAIDPALLVVDVDDTHLESAVVRFKAGYLPSEDYLRFTDQSGITGSFISGQGILTLTGTATVAEYQTALRSVQYENNKAGPTEGTLYVDFTVFDGTDSSQIGTRKIAVIDGSRPRAGEDLATVDEGGSVLIDVAANDTDGENSLDLTSIVIVSGPTYGSLTVNDDGTVTYTHDGSENFTDTFTYTIEDATSLVSNAALVNITITPVNDNTPVADTESFTVLEGGTATEANLDVGTSLLDGDTDIDLPNDTLTVNTTPVVGASYGSLTLNANGTFSYTHNGSENFSDSFTYEVRDALGNTDTATVTITVTPVNDNAPVITAAQSFTVSELAANGFSLGTTVATDADTGTTLSGWTITAGNADGIFAIDAATGEITVADNSNLDFDTTASYTLSLTVSDGTNTSAVATVAITVTDVATAITAGQSFTVAETDANGTAVGTVATTGDSPVSFTITAGNTGSAFAIDNSGNITVADTSVIDYETLTSYTLTIETSDGTTTVSETLTIDVTDVNESVVGAITDTDAAADSVAEDAGIGDAVGITALATDADGTDTVTYSLSDDAGGLFTIDTNTGVVTVNAALDAETATSHNITVLATSSDGSSSNRIFAITVTDVDEFNVGVVTDSDVTANTVAENAGVGDAVHITASATDADVDDDITYSLSDDAGGLFTIDATTGIVTIASALDYETASSHNITVLATSSDTSTSSEIFTITVTDVNDNAPVITAAQSFTVSELAANGFSLGTTVATDADTGTTLSGWTITAGNADGIFAIDAATGEITVADNSNLDFDTTASYTLSLTVSDGTNTSAVATVAITVTDVATAITAGQSFTVAETDANGTAVGTVATTGDSPVSFTITAGNTGSAFAIDNSGNITVADTSVIDYETLTSYTLTIETSDGTTTVSETLTIDVTDVNESVVGAITDTDAAADSVAEDAGIGDAVGITALATDADGTDTVTYSLSDDAGGLFTIDTNTGVVTVNAALDAETATSHNITVLATSSDGSSSNRIFAITVTDVDEFNVGVVTDSDVTANTVAENAGVGDAVHITASATDADVDDDITYSLSDDAGGLFTIDATTGIVTIASALDYETASSHNITVLATSSDTSTSSEIFTITVTDVNDNAPVITAAQSFTVSELAANGFSLGTTVATDADTGTTLSGWTITAGNADGIFAIDAATGEITVADNSNLDFDTTASYTLSLTVSDGTNTSAVATVAITVTDVATAITAGQSFTVAETDANGTAVGTVATTGDSPVSFTITAGNTGSAFAIDNSGNITVADTSVIDYETLTSYTLTIETSDGTTTVSETLTIDVTDVNESVVGAITDTDAAADSVAEDAGIGDAVGITALATDADGTDTVTYSLSDDAGGLFTIDTNTGVVTVNAALDAETATSHNITVLATSSDGSSSNRIFAITVTDVDEFNVGVVTDSDVTANTVAENAGVGDAVHITASATDADVDDDITYSLSDDAGGLFTIDATTGIVTIASALDYETASSHNITVLATSSDTSTSSEIFTITVTDVNDNAPVITAAQSFTVSELAANGFSLGTTVATDADTGTTLSGWTITAGNADGIFAIDAATGEITVADNSNLDFDTTASYTLSLTVSDGTNTSAVATVAITVTDVATAITAGQSFTVAETDANGTAVGTVATTGDSPVSFTITAGNTGSAFAIDNSGNITVADTSVIDYETLTSYTLTIETSDGTTTVSETLTIDVTDVNESVVGAITDTDAAADSVAEDAGIGDAVGITALATDADGTDTVTYSLSDDAGGLFTIDTNTGVVTVNAALDAETATSHNITVLATSSDGSSSNRIFAITVTDVDEFNVGVVTDSDVTANTVAENAGVGDAVHITASATDADVDDDITYSLSDDAGGLFTIDATTGIVTIASALDYETASSHNITVLATSSDTSTSSEIFTITVTDVNDNAPVITAAQSFTVSELAANGFSLGTTVATDADTGTTLSGWTITAGNADGIFAIDAATGEITVADNSNLDFDTTASYTLSLTVSDGTNTSAVATVAITVTDVATAITAGQSFTVAETDANGTAVGTVATTGDSPVSFTITAGNTGSAFAIDNSGNITVADTSVIDYETLTSYTLTIETSDGTTTVSETLTIDVTDVNESVVGAITDTDAAADSVAEDAGIGDAVGITALATDADGTDTVTYSLSDDAGGLFTIDTNTGVVTVNAALDAETATSHNITVLATSSDGSSSNRIFAITVTDVDEFNVGVVTDSDVTANTVAENAGVGDAVHITASATDADVDDDITYSLSDDAGGLFTIDATTGIVTIASALDYETASSHNITVLATSSDTSTSSEIFTITVTDVNDNAPVITAAQSFTVSELAANGFSLGTTVATDADTGTTLSGWTITAGNADGIFAIDAATGEITVADNSNLDFDTTASYTLSLTVSDGTNTSAVATVAITVTDVATAITAGQSFTVAETDANGTAVGTVATTGDSPVSFTITAGNTGSAFAIDNSGNITVADTSVIDYETLTSYTLTIETSDGTTTVSETLTIDVTDVNESVVGAITDTDAAADSVAEDAGIGDAVGITALATDADGTDTVTYSLSDDAGGLFTIDTNTGVVTVNAALDAETATSHNITVLATSSDGSTSSAAFTITVTDINEAPSAVDESASGNVDTAITGNVLTNDTDTEADALTASLVSGPGNGSLDLNADGSYNYTPDANWNGTDSFTYTANDGALDSNVATVTITVNPVDDTDPDDGGTTTNPDPIFEDPETDEDEDPGVEVPTYEDPVIEDEQTPPVKENLTPRNSSDADDQLVHMQESEIEDTEEIIYLTDEIDTGNQPEGREEDRSYIYFDNDLYKDTNSSKYLAINYTAADGPIPKSGDDFSILDFDSDDPNQVNVNGDHDLLRQEINESFNAELKNQAVKAKIVTITAASFAVGVVSYLLRAGSMVASLMSSLPLWRGFDPIAIFSGDKKRKKDRNEIPNTNEPKSETLFDGEEE